VRQQSERLPWAAFIQRLARFRFTVCPPGFGADTHRTWEALLAGAKPARAAAACPRLPALVHRKRKAAGASWHCHGTRHLSRSASARGCAGVDPIIRVLSRACSSSVRRVQQASPRDGVRVHSTPREYSDCSLYSEYPS
jgi:hypothetical protein